jgi:DNA (cytosine-5)-methyltransferase 1
MVEIIDLFCGAGGFSLGAHLAGFHTALAVDKDPTLTSSFSRNFPKAKLLLADLADISGETLLTKAGISSGNSIGIIGGPPCQGFSLMGKRVVDDPRNVLLQHYFRLISEIKPRFFVMENVPGLLLGNARGILDDALESLEGYEIVGPLQLNANDYGAATNRERVVIIGFLGSNPVTEAMITDAKQQFRPTVADAITDLPSPRKSGAGSYKAKVPLSTYASQARTTVKTLGNKEARGRLKKGTVDGILPTTHAPKVVARFSNVLQGKPDSVSRCPRLSWNAAAPTLRAGTGPDHGSFQSIRPIHPSQHRVITVREAARLQGFPDWFEFHSTKWHSFRMIGNSVSPHMSAAIMKVVAASIKAVPCGSWGNSDTA